MNVIIAASGPSYKDLDKSLLYQNEDVVIMAVNGAFEYLDYKADIFFTLDPSPSNLKRLSVRNETLKYCAIDKSCRVDIPDSVIKLNRISATAKEIRPRGTSKYWFHRWGCVKGLAEKASEIHTGNSAYGALGLAYHLRPEKILLLGVDGNTQSRLSGEGPPRYSLMHLPYLFSTAVKQLESAGIEVINGSPTSAIDCFPRTTPERGLEWIR